MIDLVFNSVNPYIRLSLLTFSETFASVLSSKLLKREQQYEAYLKNQSCASGILNY